MTLLTQTAELVGPLSVGISNTGERVKVDRQQGKEKEK